MDTKEEIIDFLKMHEKRLKEQYHLVRLGLFGSFARNEAKKESDVDILIELEDNTEDIHELKKSLRSYLQKSFHRNVDLAREKYLKSYAKEMILRDTIYV